MAGGLNCAGIFWALLSTIATILIVGSLLYPEWLIGRVTVDGTSAVAYFGAYKRCNYPIYDKNSKRVALLAECGRYESFAAVPSLAWQASIILATASACLALLLTLLLLPSICLNDIVTRSTAIMVGFFQVLTVMGLCGSLTLYAAGWDNPEVRDACGEEAARFQIGSCHLGRAFMSMGLGAFVLCLCALLSICGGKKEKFTRDELIRGYENTRLDLAK